MGLLLAIGSGGLGAQPPAPVLEAIGAPAALANEVFCICGTWESDLDAPRTDLVHALLEMPLNHLGMRVREWGLGPEPPPDADPATCRALVTWFTGDEVLPEWVWPWLERQAGHLLVLHLGSLKPLARDADGERLRTWLSRFGLGWDAAEMADPARIEVEFTRAADLNHESRPVFERLHHGPWLKELRGVAWMRTIDREVPRQPRVPVVTGPWGGIALQPWFVRIGSRHADRRWYVDPFAFLTEALQLRGLPVADPCVRNGRRVFLFHVDGDGFESASAVQKGRNDAQVFLERIIDRFPVPMTVSVIVASLADDLQPHAVTPNMALAREIFARPWVEPASHSVLHPLNWRRQVNRRTLPRTVVWYPGLPNYTHDMVAEVRDSIAFVDRWLVPAGKRCRVMFWSGAANPTAAAIGAARAAGCWNLNGGLTRWDALFDSVGFVTPLGRRVGGEYQVFAGASNENEFDGFFTTMPGAFRHIDETLANTGRGRILKPANLYVHFYSAEHPTRLQALEQLLVRWLESEPTIPVFASDWAAAVHDAQHGTRIAPVPGGFEWRGFVHCRTLRFDGEARSIDWERSRGVIGAHRLGASLYVTLGGETGFVALAAAAPAWPHVEQASCEVDLVRLSPADLQCVCRGFGNRLLVVAGLPPGAALRVVVDGNERSAVATAAGRCELALPPGAPAEVRVSVP